MSDDRIEHGEITNSVIAFGKGARSSTRVNRKATPGHARRGRSDAWGGRSATERGEDVTGQVIAKGRGATASGYVDGQWRVVRDEREQER